MSESIIDELVRDYVAGSSIDSLATGLGVNRTTIVHHLDRRGIERRRVVRKMTELDVQRASTRYHNREPLKVVAALFAVDASTQYDLDLAGHLVGCRSDPLPVRADRRLRGEVRCGGELRGRHVLDVAGAHVEDLLPARDQLGCGLGPLRL